MESHKVVQLDPQLREASSTYYENNKEEAHHMPENNYITKERLAEFEEKLELKMELSVKPLESKIENISYQINDLPTKFENMLLKEREYQNEKRKETNRFIVGTIGIGIVGIIVSVLGFFF